MRFRDFHPNIKIRIVVQFLTGLASMMVLPFLAIYFANRVGAVITGFMLLAVILAGVVGGFIGGFYADRVGRRKLMILSEAAVFVTFILIAFANSTWFDSPYFTFVMFIFNMFFGGLFGPASQAMIIDVSTSESRKYIFGITYWVSNLSIAIGGITGAFLFKDYRFELFMGVAIVTLISLMMTIFFIKETYVPKHESNPIPTIQVRESRQKRGGIASILVNYGKVLKDRTFMIYIVVSVLVLSLEQQLTNYIGVRLAKEMSLQSLLPWNVISLDVDGIKMLGILRAENTLLVVVCAVLITRLMKRFLDKWVMLIGILIFTMGFSILGFSNTPWVLIVAMLVGTIGELMWVPIKQAMLGDIAPSDARSSYMAVNSLTIYGAMMIGAIGITVGGFLPSWVMVVTFVVIGLVSMFLLNGIIPDLDRRKDAVKSQAASM